VLAAVPETHPALGDLAGDAASTTSCGGGASNAGAASVGGASVGNGNENSGNGPALDFDGDAAALRGAASSTLSALIAAQAGQLAELLAGADHFRKVINFCLSTAGDLLGAASGTLSAPSPRRRASSQSCSPATSARRISNYFWNCSWQTYRVLREF